jgi:hypothetical protein
MVRIRTSKDPILDIPEGSAGRGRGQVPHGNAPPPPTRPPVSLEQLLATQNNLMTLLMENEMRHEADHPQYQQQDMDSLYLDFLVTRTPIFVKTIDSLEANN